MSTKVHSLRVRVYAHSLTMRNMRPAQYDVIQWNVCVGITYNFYQETGYVERIITFFLYGSENKFETIFGILRVCLD